MSEKELIEKDLEETAQKQEGEQLRNLERYHFLKDNGYILFETITGSQAHGTNTPTSDVDKAFVYILPEDDILGTEYKEQLKIHKDFMGYEVRRFLELLKHGNPTVLELLYSPEDCVLIKHPAFNTLINTRDSFVTKVCENSFHGYAKQQRQKAEGLEKLQSWEQNRVIKKTPIDFCYVVKGYDAIPLRNYLEKETLDQKFCALAAVNHCKDLYAVYYDHEAHNAFSELVPEDIRETYRANKVAAFELMGFGYKGIAFEDSNDIRLSNIPFGERAKGFKFNISYNKDGYTKHCKDYKKYENWLISRNENRWVEIKGHGQQIDGKNMMHFMRLVHIGREIAQGNGIKIRRPDAQELLKIRRGEVSLKNIFDESDTILNEMKLLFQTSNLPESVTQRFIHKLLVKIRREFYTFHSRYGRNKAIENEVGNPFILKAYGSFSELNHFIHKMIVDKFTEYQDNNIDKFVQEIGSSIIMGGFNYNSNRWPRTVNSESGKSERVDLENFSIIGFSRDKVSVMCGGDWQDPIQFDIVIWQDTLAAVNIMPVNSWENDKIATNAYFKYLGFNIEDDEDDSE